MAKGFVYVLSNSSLPGLLKIGFSRKVPDERAEELYTTGVPEAFTVEFYCLVEGDAELEFTVHKRLTAHRHNQSREFFKVSIEQAVDAILAESKPEHVWHRNPIAMKRPPIVNCSGCGAGYVVATHCPKCKIRLAW